MNKIKDILYDKNDIFIALIILAVAAFVILWRVDVIMAYPETLVAGPVSNEGGGQNDGVVATDAAVGLGDGATSGDAVTSPSGIDGEGGNPNQVDICGIYVNYGDSLDTVAQNCVTAGLIGSKDEFMNAVNAAGAAQSIQAGQHHIPMGVTPEELIQYLIKPGL